MCVVSLEVESGVLEHGSCARVRAVAMMHRLTFRVFTTARCFPFMVLLAAMRCTVGWRGNSSRLRSLPVPPAARAHHPLRKLGVALSRHSSLPLRTAMGRSSHVSRRRRGRLRDGGGRPRTHDWSLSLPNSHINSATLTSSYEVATTIVGASANSEGVERTGDLLVLAPGEVGEGCQRQLPRRNRRQRRRQRLRLRAFGEVDAEVVEVAMSGIESNIVEAGSLDIEAAGGGQTIAVGAAAADGRVGSAVTGAKAASGEFGTALGPRAVASGIGGWLLPEEGVRSSPPLPQAAQGCAVSDREQGRSSAVVDGLRAEDDRFMRMALRLAERARMEGEVPIGAVLTETVASSSDGKRRVLSTGRNHVERRRDASAHAEMLCLQAAAKARRNWRLAGATLYVTMEPCVMCLSAAQLFRVDRVVFGAPNPNLGACGGWVDLSAQKHAFHDLEVTGGVLAEECATPLRRFFRSRRREGEAASAAGHPSAGGVAVGGATQATR